MFSTDNLLNNERETERERGREEEREGGNTYFSISFFSPPFVNSLDK